ncbi:hypothetical protein SAMN00808754_0981 [Thermanaeromonas toyohensis ToBE]|uniref:Uncharacterized protein n=1 Tax=Thermanaeromonas toyohensis ToBE TaxID=698762 RepID=A0A1W1VM89_9FIRM|nr:hypothetical protein SAMN00808754_0981 [Thermanaeromonas toyohensis ToBE]
MVDQLIFKEGSGEIELMVTSRVRARLKMQTEV